MRPLRSPGTLRNSSRMILATIRNHHDAQHHAGRQYSLAGWIPRKAGYEAEVVGKPRIERLLAEEIGPSQGMPRGPATTMGMAAAASTISTHRDGTQHPRRKLAQEQARSRIAIGTRMTSATTESAAVPMMSY